MIATMASEIGVAGRPAYMSRRGKKLTIVAHNGFLPTPALTPAKGRLIPHVTLFPRPPKAPVRLRAYKTSARPRWGLLSVGMTSAP
jgi:hypothetical protein